MSKSAENAIQTDALEQSDTSGANAQEGAPMSPRLTAMEAIVAQRQATLQEDGVNIEGMTASHTGVDVDADDGSANAASAPVARQETADDQLAVQLGEDSRATHYADPGLLVKVKIDGEELELPVSEVIKGFQKDQTASRRLTEATRILTLAEQQASKLAHNATVENNSPATESGGTGENGTETRRAKIKGAFLKLYEGDEDGAVDELMGVLGEGVEKTTQQPVDTATIAAQVRQQLAVDSAYEDLKSDYPALFGEDERGAVLGGEVVRRMENKRLLGFSQDAALRESAEEVAKLFGVEKASGRQQTEQTSTARDTKLARKAVLDFPAAASVVAGGKSSPAEAPNVSSVIQEMAAQRLGQSLGRK